MIPSGTDVLRAKWPFSAAGLYTIAEAVFLSGRMGGISTTSPSKWPLESAEKVKIPKSAWDDGLGEAAVWSAKQLVGSGNYWMLNKWRRWETYTVGDMAEDWAWNKAIRLTNKVGQKAVDRITRSPSPYQPFNPNVAIATPTAAVAGSAGVTFMLAGLLLPAFLGGLDAWGLSPSNQPPVVE